MAYCCFSVSCWPPDSERNEEKRVKSLSTNGSKSRTNTESKDELNLEGHTCCFQICSFTRKDVHEREKLRLDSCQNVLSLTERDKNVVKSQVAIWFPCVCTTTVCRALRGVKSNLAQSLNSLSIVKRSQELTKSRRQRMRYRKNWEEQKYSAMTLDLPMLSSSAKVDHFEENKVVNHQYSNTRMMSDTETAFVALQDSTSVPRHGEREINSSLGKNVDNDERVTFTEATSSFEGSADFLSIPGWFMTFLKAKPNIDIELLGENIYSGDKLFRQIELVAISNLNAIENSSFYVSIKEMERDRLEIAESKRMSLSFHKTTAFERSKENGDETKVNETMLQHKKSSSDSSSTFTTLEKKKERKSAIQGIFQDQPKINFRRKLKPYTKILPNPHQEMSDRTPSRCLQRSFPYHSESVPSGDFVGTRIGSDVNTTNDILSTLQESRKDCETTTATALPKMAMVSAEKEIFHCPIDVHVTTLNISNSSSNGINRTDSYKRDYFSSNPKPKATYTKQSTPKDMSVGDERTQTGTPANRLSRKGSSTSSPDSLVSDQGKISNYRNRFSGKTYAESSRFESRSGKTMEEFSNYKTIKTEDESGYEFTTRNSDNGRDYTRPKHSSFQESLSTSVEYTNTSQLTRDRRESITRKIGPEKYPESVSPGVLQKPIDTNCHYKMSPFAVNLASQQNKLRMPTIDLGQKGRDSVNSRDSSYRGAGADETFSKMSQISGRSREHTSTHIDPSNTGVELLHQDEDRNVRYNLWSRGGVTNENNFKEKKPHSVEEFNLMKISDDGKPNSRSHHSSVNDDAVLKASTNSSERSTEIPNPVTFSTLLTSENSRKNLDQDFRSDVSSKGDLSSKSPSNEKKIISEPNYDTLKDHAAFETSASTAISSEEKQNLVTFSSPPSSKDSERGERQALFSRDQVVEETPSEKRTCNSDTNNLKDHVISSSSAGNPKKQKEGELETATSSTLPNFRNSDRDPLPDLSLTNKASPHKRELISCINSPIEDQVALKSSSPSLRQKERKVKNELAMSISKSSKLIQDQGDGIGRNTDVGNEETNMQSSNNQSSSIFHGDGVDGSCHVSEKLHNSRYTSNESNKNLEMLDTYTAGVQNEPNRADGFSLNAIETFTNISGNTTSNAGGDEEEETAAESTNTSGEKIEKSEPIDNEKDVTGEEKKNLVVEVSVKNDEEKETEEQKKEDPCSDVLSECMRKWGRPRCGTNYSFVPNLDPPCCKSAFVPSAYQTAVEETNKEKSKDATNEESKVMKCNYTGFTGDKQSELEALIDKHVSYLRCTQGENATMPKQSNFISGAPDLYSKICKDTAFKSSAGLFNQTINKDMYSFADICGKIPDTFSDSCPKLPPLCRPPLCGPDICPPPCYRDPCPKLPKLCCTPPPCRDPCIQAPCSSKLPSIGKIPPCCPDPYLPLPRSNPDCLDPCSPPICSTDPCMKLTRPFRQRSFCGPPCNPCVPLSCLKTCSGMELSGIRRSCRMDPCPPWSRRCSTPQPCNSLTTFIDPCTGCPRPCSPPKPYCSPSDCRDPGLRCPVPCSSRASCIDPCTGLPISRNSRRLCIDPCTGLAKPSSPPPSCIDPCTGLPKPLSPRPSCIDPCTGLPKPLSPRPSCIDPCTGLPRRFSPRPSCIDSCTGLPQPLSPRFCRTIDPCTGLPKKPSPRPWCIDPCTGLPKSCIDPYSIAPISCKTVSQQYILDPITQLPVLCKPNNRLNSCLDPCDKISSISCNSASDTKLSLLNSAFSCRSRLSAGSRPCRGSLSFLMGKSCPVVRRRSASLDHCTKLDQRKVESMSLAKRFQCMESKWSGIRAKACQIFDQVTRLQTEECCPRPQPCLSPCENPCQSPVCNPCQSPVCNPCSSPIYKPCLSPQTGPYVSPTCLTSKCMQVCPESNSRGCSPTRILCCPTSPIRASTVCYGCDNLTRAACRSACNQTSEIGCRPISRCSTSCAWLNESSNKKFQVGSTKTCAEISTNVGPSLMGPQPQRKRGRSEKRCTIMRLGKSEEGVQARNPNTKTDVSCCSTQAEEGKISEIAKFVKECFDDSIVSTAANRPVVKIRYNKNVNKQHPDPCQDDRLKEQIAKAIKKGKEIQKKNSEKDGKNGTRSRTVVKFKASKNSNGACEIYNVQLENETPDVTQRASLSKKNGGDRSQTTKKESKHCHPNNLSPGGYVYRENKDNKDTSSDDLESGDSQENLNHSHRKENPFSKKNKLCAQAVKCDELRLKDPLKDKEKELDLLLNETHTDGERTGASEKDLEGPSQDLEGENNPILVNKILSQENLHTNAPKRENVCPASGDLSSKDISQVVQSGESVIESKSDLSDDGKDGYESNTNENANPAHTPLSEDDGGNFVARQIHGVLSGPGAYSYDLSKYEQCDQARKATSGSYLIDMFVELNEAPVCKLEPDTERQEVCKNHGRSSKSNSKFQRNKATDASLLQMNKNVHYLSPLNSREFRRRCLYLDDPSWEAFEYIGAHVFSLPTSYSCKRENLKKTCDGSSNRKVDMKPAKKRQVFSRSSDVHHQRLPENCQTIEERSVDKTTILVNDSTAADNYGGGESKTRVKLEGAFLSSCSLAAKNNESGANASARYQSLGFRSRSISGMKCQHRISDTEGFTKTTATQCFTTINGNHQCDSVQYKERNLQCTKHKRGSAGGDRIGNSSEFVKECQVDTCGSDGSFQGIEDLPFDSESLCSKKKSSSEKPTYSLSNTSTSPSQNKIVYAGDYVEVCSSAPFQNKSLTPKDNRLKRDGQNYSQGNVPKANTMRGPFKNKRKLKFKITPIDVENLDCCKGSGEPVVKKGLDLESEPSHPSQQNHRCPKQKIVGHLLYQSQDQNSQGKLKCDPKHQTIVTSQPPISLKLTSQLGGSGRPFDLLNNRNHQTCPQNISFVKRNQQPQLEALLNKSATFPSLCTDIGGENITKPTGFYQQNLHEFWCDELKTQQQAKQITIPFHVDNLTVKPPMIPSTLETDRLDAQTCQHVSSYHQRDASVQVVQDTLNSSTPSSSGRAISKESSTLNRDLETSGGGEAWNVLEVGCAKVIQASENRVVLQGAYVQSKSTDASMTSHENYQADNVRVVPFRLVFLRTGDGDHENTSLKGTYSRPPLESTARNVEVWGFQI